MEFIIGFAFSTKKYTAQPISKLYRGVLSKRLNMSMTILASFLQEASCAQPQLQLHRPVPSV